MLASHVTRDPLIAAVNSVLNESHSLTEAEMTALDLRKKYGGAYVSSMDLDGEYEGEVQFVNKIKNFMRKHKLSPKETAVFHEDGFKKYESFPAMVKLLKKKNIPFDDFTDRVGSGVIVFSLKPVVNESASDEIQLDEDKAQDALQRLNKFAKELNAIDAEMDSLDAQIKKLEKAYEKLNAKAGVLQDNRDDAHIKLKDSGISKNLIDKAYKGKL